MSESNVYCSQYTSVSQSIAEAQLMKGDIINFVFDGEGTETLVSFRRHDIRDNVSTIQDVFYERLWLTDHIGDMASSGIKIAGELLHEGGLFISMRLENRFTGWTMVELENTFMTMLRRIERVIQASDVDSVELCIHDADDFNMRLYEAGASLQTAMNGVQRMVDAALSRLKKQGRTVEVRYINHGPKRLEEVIEETTDDDEDMDDDIYM